MGRLFYKPENAWVGDLIPYYENGTYYGFYLHDPRIRDKEYAEDTTWHLAVNKMDLVDFSEERFNEIVSEYKKFVEPLGIPDVNCIPLSALDGDNVVDKSERTPWYKGISLLDFLETVHIDNDHNFTDFRFPVQYVLRPNLLAARFWDNDKGKITVGGMNVADVDPEKLLSLYSIVFQDVTLFNNTVMENIRIGRKDATDEEVMAAARLAHCEDFVEKMPDKWNSMIGENGSELSGGERQRISIARAFLKDAPIILMDEATASLDVDNESLIQESIAKLIQNKTVLIIAHRMRTVDGVDKIVVLKDGKVAETGSPEALKKTNGIYKHMVEMQLCSEKWKY